MTGVDDRSPSAGNSRTLGLVALILAAVAVILGFVGTVVRLRSLYSESASPISGVNPTNFVELALAIVAVVLGAIAWRRRSAGSILGAIGVGVGVAIAAPLVANLVELLVFGITQLARYHP